MSLRRAVAGGGGRGPRRGDRRQPGAHRPKGRWGPDPIPRRPV